MFLLWKFCLVFHEHVDHLLLRDCDEQGGCSYFPLTLMSFLFPLLVFFGIHTTGALGSVALETREARPYCQVTRIYRKLLFSS